MRTWNRLALLFLAGIVASWLIGCDFGRTNMLAKPGFGEKDEVDRPWELRLRPEDRVDITLNDGAVKVKRTSDGEMSLALPSQLVAVKPNTRYRISADLKTERYFAQLFMEASLIDDKGRETAWQNLHDRISGTHPWKRYSFEIKTAPDTAKVRVYLLRSYRFLGGTAWVRNPRMVEF